MAAANRWFAVPEHDPEKWMPVFRKDHAQSKNLKRDGASTWSHRALDRKWRMRMTKLRLIAATALATMVAVPVPAVAQDVPARAQVLNHQNDWAVRHQG